MSTVETFNSYVKKLWDSDAKEFGPCGYCEEMISRRDVGENEVAVNLTVEFYNADDKPITLPAIYHRGCCPCQTDQKVLNDEWEILDVRFNNKAEPRSLYAYEWVGILSRCPFCGRIYDDDGTEVAL